MRKRKVDAGDLHAEILKVCPIVGCDSDGKIDFDRSATDSQKQAAQAVMDGWDWSAEVEVPVRPSDEIKILREQIKNLTARVEELEKAHS